MFVHLVLGEPRCGCVGLLLVAQLEPHRIWAPGDQLQRAAEALAVRTVLDLALAERCRGGIGQHEDILLERHRTGVREQGGEHLAPLPFAHPLEHRGPQRVQLRATGWARRAAGAAVGVGAGSSTGAAERVGARVTRGSSGGGPDVPRSSRSSLVNSASTDASALGRAAFSSATSSCVRGSAPSFTAEIASASRSMGARRPPG